MFRDPRGDRFKSRFQNKKMYTQRKITDYRKNKGPSQRRSYGVKIGGGIGPITTSGNSTRCRGYPLYKMLKTFNNVLPGRISYNEHYMISNKVGRQAVFSVPTFTMGEVQGYWKVASTNNLLETNQSKLWIQKNTRTFEMTNFSTIATQVIAYEILCREDAVASFTP